MYKFRTARLPVGDRRRILVTSDIHGHPDRLREALDKAAFGGDDLLVVVGDLLEKGWDSLGTLRFLKGLAEKGRALVLMGNVDLWRLEEIRKLAARPDFAGEFLHTLQSLRAWKNSSFFDEMCRELGLPAVTAEQVAAAVHPVLDHFAGELNFLATLPTVLESDRYLFVHGGLPDPALEHTLSPETVPVPRALLKLDRFLTKAREKGWRFDRYLVAGHWPVGNYSTSVNSANPVWDGETHILSIDGGCGINHYGQLNLLILPHIGCAPEEITHVWADGWPTARAKDPQAASADPFTITWGDHQVRFLQYDRGMVRVEHIRTGRRMWIPAHKLYWVEDPAALEPGTEGETSDVTDYLLPVAAGDTLSVLERTSRGTLVKKNGVIGWYEGELEE